MTRSALLFLSFLTFNSSGLPAQTLKAPTGKTVMIDAKISPSEWDDAGSLELFSGGKLYVKRDAEYVYLAVRLPEGNTMTVDLYIDDGTQPITDLHASARLGERVPRQDGWSNDDWHWANNRDWVANVSRVKSWEPREFFDENVREFQIKRSRFPAKKWRVMLEAMKRETDGKWSTTPFPAKADNLKPDERWLTLTIED
jgi:hypothetical protein